MCHVFICTNEEIISEFLNTKHFIYSYLKMFTVFNLIISMFSHEYVLNIIRKYLKDLKVHLQGDFKTVLLAPFGLFLVIPSRILAIYQEE